MQVSRIYAAGTSGEMSFDEAVDALKRIAADPKSDPDEAKSAKSMLEAMANTGTDVRRAKASRALRGVAEREAMNARMGLLRAPSTASHREGRTQTFPVLTRDAARKLMR